MSGIGPHHPTRQTTDQPHQPSTAAACRWSRSWVEIDLGALRRNYRLCRELACRGGAGDCLIPAIKKDGYGHGLLNVARALTQEPGLWGFAIATVEEAVLLRGPESGVGRERRLLMLAPLHGEALEEAIRLDVDLTVTDATEAAEVARAARRLGARATVHFKLDTGMGRIGRLPAEAAGEFARVLAMPELRVAAVYSHMADAWNSVESRDSQRRAMEAFRSAAPGVAGLPVHWGGSDALAFAEAMAPGDGLRVGIAVYGDHPAAAFEPVMTFRTRVIYRRRVPAGTTISYGGTYTTSRTSELAIIGAGYGNGLPRVLGNRAQVLIAGRRCPILGRVCMDQAVVDVTDLAAAGGEVRVDDEVVLFGRQTGGGEDDGGAILPAAEQAALAGTISYELFCVAGQLNPRVLIGDR